MAEAPSSENTDQETDVWIRRVLGQAIKVTREEESDSEDGPLEEPNYEAFRSVEDLTDTAQALYRAASKLLFTTSKSLKLMKPKVMSQAYHLMRQCRQFTCWSRESWLGRWINAGEQNMKLYKMTPFRNKNIDLGSSTPSL